MIKKQFFLYVCLFTYNSLLECSDKGSLPEKPSDEIEYHTQEYLYNQDLGDLRSKVQGGRCVLTNSQNDRIDTMVSVLEDEYLSLVIKSLFIEGIKLYPHCEEASFAVADQQISIALQAKSMPFDKGHEYVQSLKNKP